MELTKCPNCKRMVHPQEQAHQLPGQPYRCEYKWERGDKERRAPVPSENYTENDLKEAIYSATVLSLDMIVNYLRHGYERKFDDKLGLHFVKGKKIHTLEEVNKVAWDEFIRLRNNPNAHKPEWYPKIVPAAKVREALITASKRVCDAPSDVIVGVDYFIQELRKLFSIGE